MNTIHESEIVALRLAKHKIINPQHTTPQQVVQYMGCMQAQDYHMAKWAIGSRMLQTTDVLIDAAFSDNQMIRTHVLRPTWHFVSPENIRWMLALTAPRIMSLNRSMMEKLGIDSKMMQKSFKLLEKILQKGPVERTVIQTQLSKNGIATDENRLSHILMQAELEQLICSGGRIGKQQSYAWLDSVVPIQETYTKEDALAQLATIYFTSHGPATVQDFAWWSGLTLSDAKKAFHMIHNHLTAYQCNNENYWMLQQENTSYSNDTPLFLAAFDELFISYKNRTAFLPKENMHYVMTLNGIFYPFIMYKNKIVGVWKRQLSKSATTVQITLFDKKVKLSKEALIKGIQPYAAYMQLPVEVDIKTI